MKLIAGERYVLTGEENFLRVERGALEVYAVTRSKADFRQEMLMQLAAGEAAFPSLDEFEGMDVSAFVKIEDEGDLYFRPYTRNTTVWEDKLQQQGAFLDAWQNPSDPAVMEAACDNAQKIIEEAIANE